MVYHTIVVDVRISTFFDRIKHKDIVLISHPTISIKCEKKETVSYRHGPQIYNNPIPILLLITE